jgi:hypothetical protein
MYTSSIYAFLLIAQRKGKALFVNGGPVSIFAGGINAKRTAEDFGGNSRAIRSSELLQKLSISAIFDPQRALKGRNIIFFADGKVRLIPSIGFWFLSENYWTGP